MTKGKTSSSYFYTKTHFDKHSYLRRSLSSLSKAYGQLEQEQKNTYCKLFIPLFPRSRNIFPLRKRTSQFTNIQFLPTPVSGVFFL